MENLNKINEESDRNLNANDNNKPKDANHSDKSEELDISQNWNQTGIKDLEDEFCKAVKDLKLVENLDEFCKAMENKIKLSLHKKYLVNLILNEQQGLLNKPNGNFKQLQIDESIVMLHKHLMLISEQICFHKSLKNSKNSEQICFHKSLKNSEHEYCNSDELKKFIINTFDAYDGAHDDSHKKLIKKYIEYINNLDDYSIVEQLIKYHEGQYFY